MVSPLYEVGGVKVPDVVRGLFNKLLDKVIDLGVELGFVVIAHVFPAAFGFAMMMYMFPSYNPHTEFYLEFVTENNALKILDVKVVQFPAICPGKPFFVKYFEKASPQPCVKILTVLMNVSKLL